jgi:3-methyladenine DNA glycosylase Mpg
MCLENDIGEQVDAHFFNSCANDVAAKLVGCYLFAGAENERTGGQIIEVEAYCEPDPAAHCHEGAHPTRFNES